MRLRFESIAQDGNARTGKVTMARGSFRTPVFMPVGTRASIKALSVAEIEALGVEIMLANAYHLELRPGSKLIEGLGGLHRFCGWNRLLLTDSGGYQVFSLRGLSKISDKGVTFRSPIDGASYQMGPEESMTIQAALGADIAMAFDHCPPSGADVGDLRIAMQRTTAWAHRCLEVSRPDHQARFAIVQGGIDLDLRHQHLEELSRLPFEGLALGGLSVGEAPAQMHAVVRAIAPKMPQDRPRYLMGVGRPEDLLVGIGAGIDMFDCVMPTRHARNGHLFTRTGHIVISNACHRESSLPVDPSCNCRVCSRYTRAYLRHLYTCRELTYHQLATYHNLHFYMSLINEARAAIAKGNFAAFVAERLETAGVSAHQSS